MTESVDISVHRLMQIVHTFWADLNIKLNIQTFQYIHSFTFIQISIIIHLNIV